MKQRPFFSRISSVALALGLSATGACSHLDAKTSQRQAFDPGACRSGAFDVYFKPEQAALSAEGKAQIEALRQDLSGCRIDGISIVSLADRTHETGALAEARADAVAAALSETGIARDKLRVLARGTAQDSADLMQRRAVITVQASPATVKEPRLLVASGR